jgi:alpha-tubulin suppressor-like RCC1 family protein
MGGNFTEPVKVKPPGMTVAVAGGDNHSLALLANGTVLGSGENEAGQLGDGTTSSSAVPVPVCKVKEFPCKPENYLREVVAIAAAGPRSMALLANGHVVDWGEGQLGDGSTTGGPETCRVGARTPACSRVPVEVVNLSGVKAIAEGAFHSLAVSNGHVFAWGANIWGQLGNGKEESSNVPVEAIGISTATAIAAGRFHSLALLSNGHVDAWGLGGKGQLGDGEYGTICNPTCTGVYHATVPTPVICAEGETGPCEQGQLSGVIAIAAGFQHSLARLGNGHVMTWGYNSRGQLGIGTTEAASAETVARPREVCAQGATAPCSEQNKNVLSGVTGIAGGFEFSTALLGDGHVVNWGDDTFGQFGTGANPEPSTVPVQGAAGLSEVGAVAAGGNFSVDLLRNGVVESAGENEFGQLGSGTKGPEICVVAEEGKKFTHLCSTTPVELLQLQPPVAVAAGSRHSLALLSDGTVLAWGNNEHGQLGDGTTSNRDVAVPVCKVAESPCKSENYLRGVVAIAAAADQSIALLSNGHVVAWGENERGQLGDGKTEAEQPYSDVPVGVTGIGEGEAEATAIAAGVFDDLAVLRNGHVKAWGNNAFGQLGNNTRTSSSTPVEVSGLSEATAVAGGWGFSLALMRNGRVEAWGLNSIGQLGIGTSGSNEFSLVPVEVHNLGGATAIAAGTSDGVALLGDGHVEDWGYNEFGQLGNETTTASSLPVKVTGVSDATAIAAGLYHNLALRRNGQVMDWGYNSNGQLGNGTTTNRDVPVLVPKLIEAIAVAGGSADSLAIGQP